MLLQVVVDQRRPPSDAVVVPLESLDALTVHDVGSLDTAPDGVAAAPTRLALKRRAGELGTEVGEAVLGRPLPITLEDVPEEVDGLRAVDDMLTAVAALLRELGSDSVGKAALISAVKRLTVRFGEEVEATVSAGTLLVTTHRGFGGRTGREALRAAVERAL
jgi:hypothetical protein